MQNWSQQSKCGSIVAGAGLLFICVATLTPGPPGADSVATACRGWCDDSIVADFARNVVLFVPMAFGLRLAGVRRLWSILIGCCLSATVEILQIRTIVGRDASALDWFSNTIGTLAGVLLADHLATLFRPAPRVALRLIAVVLVVWTGMLILGAWGIQPAPGGFPYFGERAPRLKQFEYFLGELVSVRTNGVELPSSLIRNSDTIRAGLRAGQLHVDAVVRPGPQPTTSDIAPIARVEDGADREILMLGRAGHELVFRLRLRATTLRLETPAFALAHAFQSGPGIDPESLDTVESLSAGLKRGRVQLVARSATASAARTFELSPAVAWSFFLPWDYWFGPNSVWISYVWLATLLLPAGYWGAIAAHEPAHRWFLIGAAGVIASGVEFIPALFTMPPASGWSFAAAFGGVAAGWALSILAERSGVARAA
jgi:VanZ family protein